MDEMQKKTHTKHDKYDSNKTEMLRIIFAAECAVKCIIMATPSVRLKCE